MNISQWCKTWLLTTSCAFLLLSGAAVSYAQTSDSSDSIDYLYVSPQGSDSWSGQSPAASGGGGPFQTLAHAQETVSALAEAGLTRPLEIAFDAGVSSPQDFLSRWFTDAPNGPVIWHFDSSRTILIYTPTLTEQNQALSAEDYMTAGVTNSGGSAIARFYVASSGSDSWSGLYPSADADNGPFQSLNRAQEAVNAFEAQNPNAPVEVVVEAGLAGGSESLDAAAGKSAHKPAKPAAGAAQKAKAVSKSVAAAKSLSAKSLSAKRSGILGNPIARMSQSPHFVFAHYMVCNRDYGGSVAGYERDIQDAQAAGVDGFALNIGWWSGANYKQDTASMFQAAHALGTGFKLFFSVDEGSNNLTTQGMPASDILDMVKTYGNDPSYFSYSGRSVLSTWGGEGPSISVAHNFWLNQVLIPLRSAGFNVYFVPLFSAKYYASNWSAVYPNPTPQNISQSYQLWWKDIVDGLFQISVGPPTNPTNASLASQQAYAQLMHQNAKIFMSSVSPQYWGDIQGGSRGYNEFHGGEGLDIEWNSIINVQKPNWVELFTWNDFDESTYFSPIDDVCKYWPDVTGHRTLDFYKSHAGELALTKYYIQWYKTGVKPTATNDAIYFFYRTQPMNMVATNDTRGPVASRTGGVQDVIYVTAILPSAATLQVTSGSTQQTFQLPAGNSSIRVPFSVGSQTFTLSRNGKQLLTKQGEPVVSSAPEYNFNYYTGSASD